MLFHENRVLMETCAAKLTCHKQRWNHFTARNLKYKLFLLVDDSHRLQKLIQILTNVFSPNVIRSIYSATKATQLFVHKIYYLLYVAIYIINFHFSTRSELSTLPMEFASSAMLS